MSFLNFILTKEYLTALRKERLGCNMMVGGKSIVELLQTIKLECTEYFPEVNESSIMIRTIIKILRTYL